MFLRLTITLLKPILPLILSCIIHPILLLVGVEPFLTGGPEARAFSERPTDDPSTQIVKHRLNLALNPDRHSFIAKDRLTVKILKGGLETMGLALSSALRITGVTRLHESQAEPLSFLATPSGSDTSRPPRSTEGLQVITVALDRPAREGQVLVLEFGYEGTINDPPRPSGQLRFVTPNQTSGHIGEEGIYLSGETGWYPDVEGSRASFDVEVTLPAGWVAVTHGRQVSQESNEGSTTVRWEVRSKTEALTLVANRFVKHERNWNGIELATYLFPEDAELSEEYLEATETYLKTYTNILGPYPFPKFAVVENFFPSGLGMPSFTLLGSGVIKRRYTQPYALGHEIVHSWLGNWVLNDFEKGNWVEGLTTYLANYYFEELTGSPEQAGNQRRMMLLGYAVYVRPEEDYPLNSFRHKVDQKDNAIGYQKAAMVFHMLRREIGDRAFWDGIKRVVNRHGGSYADWGDLEKRFSETSGRDLRWFFSQWVERAGAPRLNIREAEAVPLGPGGGRKGGYRVTVRMTQEEPKEIYRLRLPVRVTLESGLIRDHDIEVRSGNEDITFLVPERPVRLQVDPGFESFRRLPRKTLSPMLNLFVTDVTRMVIVPTRGTETTMTPYSGLAKRIISREPDVTQVEIPDASGLDGSVLVLGGPDLNPAAGWAAEACGDKVRIGADYFQIGTQRYDGSDHALLVSCRHPARPQSVVTLFYGLSPGAASKVARLLFFYGWQSYLVFQNGRVVDRGDFAPDSNELEVSIHVP